jgi:mRNA interferase RelE/StbE
MQTNARENAMHAYTKDELISSVACLDNRVRILVLKQIKKLSLTPGLGSELGQRQGMNLSGYRKLYAD